VPVVDITYSPQPVLVGEPTTLTVTLKNEGDAPVGGSQLTAGLDPELQIVSLTATTPTGQDVTQEGCIVNGPDPVSGSYIQCTVGDVLPGQTATLNVVATPSATGRFLVFGQANLLLPEPGTTLDSSRASARLNVEAVNGQTPPPPPATTKAACKKGGYQALGFKNQGQCIRSMKGRS
jgi:uncharacterized repeat protein (TIGR01451 family)